jgi:serine/threonine protein kinase
MLALTLWARYTCSIMQPEKIGIYEVKSELGRGGMATVYLAYDPRFEREVAVKVLPRELLHADPQFRLRFEREAKIIAQLEHSAIVPVYDVGEADGQPYFVMRYMNGGSLSERIKAGNMTVEEAARILSIVAPGLDEAHSKGIIHRDIKPSNILFDRRNNPYISDFGIAKLTQAQAGNVTGSAIIGTPAYMAPEQAQGDAVDGRADIYALGIILYEMLIGRQPYEADTPMAVAIKHITDPVPQILLANPKLPQGMDTIIQKAMAKNKNDRFSTTVDLTNALHDLKHNVPTQFPTKVSTPPVKETAVSQKPASPAASKKAFSPLAVILPILLIGVVAGGFFVFNAFNSPAATQTPAPTFTSAPVFTETTAPTEAATEVIVPVEIATDTPVAVTDTAAAPSLPTIGGADKIAFVANKEIYIMNVDGSELTQITTDGGLKSDLQWLPDGKNLIFISGFTVKYYNLDTDSISVLMDFPGASSVNAFRVSHDGTQVMITVNNEIFIVPFSFEGLKEVSRKSDLLALKFCIDPRGGTEAAARIREVRWSSDDKRVAWLYRLATDIISIYDINHCDPTKLEDQFSIPSALWSPPNFNQGTIPDFDWNGDDLFIFNTIKRFESWGDLHLFNQNGRPVPLLNPVDKKCCYRDVRWSPDSRYILFAYQEEIPGQTSPTLLYYVAYSDVISQAILQPIPLPEGLFKDPREAPQPALRPAQ